MHEQETAVKVPADIHFRSMVPQVTAEATVRRRIRRLDAIFPFVLSWQVTLEHSPQHGAAVRVTAHLPGSSIAAGRAFGTGLLGAVRAAFRAVEHELEQERGQARARAAVWLGPVQAATSPLQLSA
jgi:hypothetical protein